MDFDFEYSSNQGARSEELQCSREDGALAIGQVASTDQNSNNLGLSSSQTGIVEDTDRLSPIEDFFHRLPEMRWESLPSFGADEDQDEHATGIGSFEPPERWDAGSTCQMDNQEETFVNEFHYGSIGEMYAYRIAPIAAEVESAINEFIERGHSESNDEAPTAERDERGTNDPFEQLYQAERDRVDMSNFQSETNAASNVDVDLIHSPQRGDRLTWREEIFTDYSIIPSNRDVEEIVDRGSSPRVGESESLPDLHEEQTSDTSTPRNEDAEDSTTMRPSDEVAADEATAGLQGADELAITPLPAAVETVDAILDQQSDHPQHQIRNGIIRGRKATKKDKGPCRCCGITFSRKSELTRHRKTALAHSKPKKTCDLCERKFTREDARERHLREIHGDFGA
ncbi:hypothetical protein EVG20_g6869 [Dentipellis fragilis]|uniref:C2H2-type domain-containing protein n=1 Tax=Dentipellis fragilis TaxID=205917 RepID=A0A4Y9YHB0_9AGAM|nr:hypothetical protein EVG20_g6869 [Dentipellis fragilis]